MIFYRAFSKLKYLIIFLVCQLFATHLLASNNQKILANDVEASPVDTVVDLTGISADIVQLPYIQLAKSRSTGSYTTISGDLLEKYPSTDIRNSFTGLVNGVNVRENQGAPGVHQREHMMGGANVSVFSRGMGMQYMVDGVPVNINEIQINPEEIASVTFIKDILGKAMFGPVAANGIVLIKTKRGFSDDNVMKVNVERGISMVDRFPEMVSGADYARLNNIARANSGLPTLYSSEDIAAYALNNPNDPRHPSANFRDMTLKDTRNFTRMNVSAQGGNESVRYFAHVGYNGEDDIIKIGSGSDFNRLNARSNIDIDITDYFNVQFDFVGNLTIRNSPNYSMANPLYEFPAILSDINSIAPIAFPVYANTSADLSKPWYGISNNYEDNPLGRLENQGNYTETGRSGIFNSSFNFDFSSWIDGLSSRTFFGIDGLNLTRVGQSGENYPAYIVSIVPNSAGEDSTAYQLMREGSNDSEISRLAYYYYQNFSVSHAFNYSNEFGNHFVEASASFFGGQNTVLGYRDPLRIVSTTASALYSYKEKYNIHGVLNYSGSASFEGDNRYLFSPSIGLSWNASEEGFLQDVAFISSLKIRAQAGTMGYEQFLTPFSYRNNWNADWTGGFGAGGYSNQWLGSGVDGNIKATVLDRMGNADLSFEKRIEYNAGIDLSMFENSLQIESNYYNQLRDGIVTRPYQRVPFVGGIGSGAIPMQNFGQIRYSGIETDIKYVNDKRAFKYAIGVNGTWQTTLVEAANELDYRYDYQQRVGIEAGAIFGQTYLGKFQSDEETLLVPQLFDDELHAGDLKYKDMNGDGVVDDNDQSQIGSSIPKLFYGINVFLSYKGFELTAVAAGQAFNDVLLSSNSYFNGGSGNDNYSKFILENHGDLYPRLTYNRVNNNFQSSEYWLRDGGFLKIKNVELAWNIPTQILNNKVNQIRLFVRGANLYTFSSLKEIDPESPYSGIDRYPLFTTVTTGVKLTF